MPPPSTTHLVLIPSYDTGPILERTVRDACAAWNPVWVVVDGSTDGSAQLLARLSAELPALRFFVLPENRGKGSAILHGLQAARAAGFTHALAMDADGQHPADRIPAFMDVSRSNPRALVLGKPVFDASAPQLRVQGRKVSNSIVQLETLWGGVGDSLFGMRVYPAADLLALMEPSRWMRRFDFDVEAAVRLAWRGLPLVNLPTPVRYLSSDEGGVSHFRYGRDNLLLAGMHARLLAGFLVRFPLLVWRRVTGPR